VTGREFYAMQCELAEGWGMALPEWDELTQHDREAWEVLAFDQTLRDRPLPEGVFNAHTDSP
jgi:hypothetical protein